MNLTYIDQVWAKTPKGQEIILTPGQALQLTGPKGWKIQHRVLTVPVSNNNPEQVIVRGGGSITLLGTYPSAAALEMAERRMVSNRIEDIFGWYMQGIHDTSPVAPSHLLNTDKYAGLKKYTPANIKEFYSAFVQNRQYFTSAEDFLPKIYCSTFDPSHPGDKLWDVKSECFVNVLALHPATFLLCKELGDNEADINIKASIILKTMIAQLWSNFVSYKFDTLYNLAEGARIYIGYPEQAGAVIIKNRVPAYEASCYDRRVFITPARSAVSVLSALVDPFRKDFQGLYDKILVNVPATMY